MSTRNGVGALSNSRRRSSALGRGGGGFCGTPIEGTDYNCVLNFPVLAPLRIPSGYTAVLSMKTLHLTTDNDSSVERAAGIIRAGGLVAFATEKVYGLDAGLFDSQ